MVSVKIVLRKKKNLEGKYPLGIRLTKGRKSSYDYIGQYIKESDWDQKNRRVKNSHPNSQRLNNLLLKRLAEFNDGALKAETSKPNVSIQEIKKEIKPSSGGASFFAQANIYIDNLKKNGKYSRVPGDESRLKRFREYVKKDNITFHDINYSLLTNFKAYLRSAPNSLSDRSIVNFLILIRTIYNQAIASGLVDRKYYPFGKGKVHFKIPESIKIGLNEEDVKKLEEIKLDRNSYPHHARNVWLFSFYFAGMRISDVLCLKWSDFQNDRLHYKMGKNAKSGSLKIPEKALKIIKEYELQKRRDDDFVFPDLKMLDDLNNSLLVRKKISNAVSRLNKALRQVQKITGIKKKITTHIARHTFGNLSGEKIPIQMLQKLYRHSSVMTTIGYQSNFIFKDVDEALNKVIDP